MRAEHVSNYLTRTEFGHDLASEARSVCLQTRSNAEPEASESERRLRAKHAASACRRGRMQNRFTGTATTHSPNRASQALIGKTKSLSSRSEDRDKGPRKAKTQSPNCVWRALFREAKDRTATGTGQQHKALIAFGEHFFARGGVIDPRTWGREAGRRARGEPQ